MKFRLVSLGHADDPFGYVPPRTVEASDQQPGPTAFQFAADSWLPPASSKAANPGDVFSALSAGPPEPVSLRFEKIALVSAAREDEFAGLGGGHPVSSALSDFEKFTLAPSQSADCAGLEAVERESTFTKSAAATRAPQQLKVVSLLGDEKVRISIGGHEVTTSIEQAMALQEHGILGF